ncbi:MAG: D-alanyl-D-alanine carboxypeptidase [Oscillospiraceae bacterium]|nr:D-alanyl-D-alanine carboxypeptidase [Oscillospiraceae bacterium]
MKSIISVFLCVLITAITVQFWPFQQVMADGLSVSAQAAILINADTGEAIYEKNAHLKLSMASTTKIMTALLLAEQNTPEKTVVTTKQMVTVEGSSMGLLEGDTVSYKALLCGMLLSSGNDAANTTAIILGGSLPNFAIMMNAKAKEIGMTDTHFVTPSGLDDADHYSTAFDMALLASYAMKNADFKEVASSKEMIVYYGNPPYKRTLGNHNKLLSMYDGAEGVKTGFTKKSGRCLVSSAERDGKSVIAVTLNAPDDWDDHIAMFDFGFSQLVCKDITYKFEDPTLPVVGGKFDRVKLNVSECKVGLLNKEYSEITYEIILPPFLYAPVVVNKEIGSVIYKLNGEQIAESKIWAVGNVEAKVSEPKSKTDLFFDKLQMLLQM